MSSANNTLDAEDANSTGDKDSLPSTASVLDKSRSLFGNSSATLSTPARDPTPDTRDGEASAAAPESVAMETDDSHEAVSDKKRPDSPGKQPDVSEEPMDTTEQPKDVSAESSETPVEEEVLEKKIISMDTSGDAEDLNAANQNGEEDEDEMEDEEEEEAPRKKAKRNVPTSEDDMDDTQDDEQSEEPEQKEEQIDEKEDQEEESGTVESPVEESSQEGEPTVLSDDSSSLKIDESSEKAVEADAVEEEETASNAEKPEKDEDQPEQTQSSRRNTRNRKSAAAASSSTNTPRRERASRGSHKKEEVDLNQDDTTEDADQKGEDPAEEQQDVVETPNKGRSRRSAAALVDVPDEEDQEITTQKRGRGRRSAATPQTPKPTVKNPDEEEQQAVVSPTKRTRTPRGRKGAAKVEEVDEKEEIDEPVEEVETPTTSRRSTRAKQPPKTTPSVETKRTPVRTGRQKKMSVTEEVTGEADEVVETPSTKKRQTAKNTPASSKKKDDYDPYDLDTEIEHHPEPLKNIQMEVQNFGAVKYAKAGTSESKYSMTERTAESRIHELQTSSGSKNRRSLADMTPGKEKVKHKMTYSTPAAGRKSKNSKQDDHEDDAEMDTDELPTSSSVPAGTPSSAGRGKKRKSNVSGSATVPPAKRQLELKIRTLNDEEQLQVDHPQEENEPYAPGARVYANFSKTFYPAIIISERDGLGRYKLKFTDDDVVKDVPNAGIVPLRAVTSGKVALYQEEEVLVESGPDDISAATWYQGKVIIRTLNEEGEPTEETKTIDWTDLSFDHSEWRDHLKSKVDATAIVTSNITTISEATRARKPTVKVVPKTRKLAKGEDLASSRGGSTPRTPDEDEDKILTMHEKAVGKNIFAGKLFMLTSANRSHSQTGQVQPMLKKKNLIEFICQNGGIVTESFSESSDDKDRFLISDTYYRTHKYLAALASSIPCVSNIWIQQCAEKGELVDYKEYILPAGASIFDETEKPAPENPPSLLGGKIIYVHSTHAAREITQNGPGGTFVDIWAPMLKKLGATIVEHDWKTLEGSGLQFDVVLVDGTFQDEVIKYADSIDASKVTSEWVIQTIILNGAPDPKSHPKFDPFRLHHRPRQSP